MRGATHQGIPGKVPGVAMTETLSPDLTRVLVVDDDASVRDVITVLLREEGYACTAVSSACCAPSATVHW